MKRKVIFYKLNNSVSPVQDFLDSLQGKAAQKVAWVLKLLEDFIIVPKEYLKRITSTQFIWECRIKFGSDSYRILCFFTEVNEIVLTNGFIKKTKKIPKCEIEKAELYRNDFLRSRKI